MVIYEKIFLKRTQMANTFDTKNNIAQLYYILGTDFPTGSGS